MFNILCIGEILFDVYPDDKRLGGAPFNFSYHMRNFGCEVAFVSRIGDDDSGAEILAKLKESQFPDTYIQQDEKHETGKVKVKLDDKGVPDFTIVEPAAYDFIESEPRVEDFLNDSADLIYVGTLAQRNAKTRNTVQHLLANKPGKTRAFYDVNLRQSFYTEVILTQTLRGSDIVKLNEDEFETLSRMQNLTGDHAQAGQQMMQDFDLKGICITKGATGSALILPSEKIEWRNEAENQSVIDTVGAGDGYSSVLAYGWLQGWPHDVTIERASHFAAALCEISGAIPDSRDFYRKYAPWAGGE